MARHRIYSMAVGSVYPHYIAKAEKKGRTKDEVDEILRWLTGYSKAALAKHLAARTDFETFFAKAPAPHPHRALVRGTICGVRIDDIDDPLMKEVRRLDKMIDELAKGKAMERILREPAADARACGRRTRRVSPRERRASP